MCDGYRAGLEELETGAPWEEPTSTCDPGTLSSDAIDDTIRRVNLYRWLVGLDPVTEDLEHTYHAQACSLMMLREGRSSTSPDSSWTCYLPEGADAAANALVSDGFSASTSAWAVSELVRDDSPELLGRGAVLAPDLESMSVGWADGFQCLTLYERGGATERPWIAFPNPGVAPWAAALNRWSFHADMDLSEATVSMVEDGFPIDIDVHYAERLFGLQALTWEPSDGYAVQPDRDYVITIEHTSSGTIRYALRLSFCR